MEFYTTAAYACSYLPGHIARSEVADPATTVNPPIYNQLIRHGFRRSGSYVYRPHCDHCRACQAIRLVVQDFLPNRSQQRAWRQHDNLVAQILAPHFSQEHYDLYLSYQQSRHAGGGMDQNDPPQYIEFLVKTTVDTWLVEFRDPAAAGNPGQLRMVSIVDRLEDGLSAVYTFFDPSAGQSFGSYNVLWQIRQAASLGLPYVYLGYWIEACQKMAYKTRFKPCELLIAGQWQRTNEPPRSC